MTEGFAESLGTFIPIILIFVVFFFVLIFPQKRREKKIKEMLANIKTGNKVKTIGGIYGKVVSVKDDLIVVETGPDKAKLVFVRGAIAAVDTSDEEMDLIESKDVK
ncbi:MAG: preprotein translocase subunit YajC [Eubacteriales bacterium]